MTDINTVQDEQNDLADLSIQELRKLAKFLEVPSQRDWTKEDFVAALQAQREASEDALAAFQPKSASNESMPSVPRPGYARILIFRDPTTGHANSPVPVGVNGRMFLMPRGMEIDVPIAHVQALNDAKQTVIRQTQEPDAVNPGGKVVEEVIQSYPFQVLQITPGGKFTSPEDQRGAMAQRKQKFVDIHKRWPTKGELDEFEKEQVRKGHNIA